MRKSRIYTEIRLPGMHPQGRAFGYIGKRKIFLDGGIPGELVNAGQVEPSADHLYGEVIHVTEPSPYRVEPFCKHAGRCGGCTWQHIDYPYQLELKRQILSEALERNAIAAPQVPLPVASPENTHYRHRMDYAFSARRWYYEGEGKVDDPSNRIALGFHPLRNPHKVIDIEECHLQRHPGRMIAESVRQFTIQNGFSYYDPKTKTGLLRQLTIRVNRAGEAMVILTYAEPDMNRTEPLNDFLTKQFPEIKSLYWCVIADPSISWQDTDLEHVPGTDRRITELANDLKFHISPRSFYQPNPSQAENFLRVLPQLADLKGDETVIDLYSGIGTLGITLAKNTARLIGIEASADAVLDARFNARTNGLDMCTFIHGDVLQTFTPEFTDKNGKPDVILLDPPRSGTLIEIKKTILQAAPRKIIYLSCDPFSLSNDLKMLTQGYRVTYLQPYDQFPHTHHLETMVLLEKQR